MENQLPPEQKNKMRKLLPYLFVGVFAFVALISLFFAYQANMKTKTTPPEYKKVSAVIGTEIPVSVKTDGVSLYFEHNGERLSLTNRITDLMVGTEYTFTFTNDSGMKQGVFIPALRESIVTDATQTVSISIKFTNPGIYYFMGNIYQTGWDGLKSGFEVGMDTIVTQPPTQSTPTVTPTATATLTLTPTPTPTEPPGTTFSCANVTEIPQAECEALVALYNSTNGPGWTNKTGWLQNQTPCSWYGVVCGGGNVNLLGLVTNNLVGTLPASLGSFTRLSTLFLGNNQLTGTIPDSIGNLTLLQNLSIQRNQLIGNIPTSISNLTLLQSLDLGYNQLTGTIPDSIGNLRLLDGLILQGNRLTGTIPDSIGNLTRLQSLGLGYNQLTGTIPDSIGSLVQMTHLSFTANQLTGAIPTNIGNLTLLRTLNLGDNQLTGSIPLSIVNLTQLQSFTVNVNQLSGAIPPSLGSLTALTGLGLENNLFTGNIPPQIGNLVNLTTLHLKNNQLSGTVPSSFSNLIRISGFNLSIRDNNLTGVENQSVCPWLVAHTQSNWWEQQNPPIASDPCQGMAQPVAARTSGVARPTTMPLPNPNILDRITLFFQQLLQNVFGKK